MVFQKLSDLAFGRDLAIVRRIYSMGIGLTTSIIEDADLAFDEISHGLGACCCDVGVGTGIGAAKRVTKVLVEYCIEEFVSVDLVFVAEGSGHWQTDSVATVKDTLVGLEVDIIVEPSQDLCRVGCIVGRSALCQV